MAPQVYIKQVSEDYLQLTLVANWNPSSELGKRDNWNPLILHTAYITTRIKPLN